MVKPLSTGLSSLPCPECRAAGVGGGARIGHRRRVCRTCNNFNQNVLRLAGKRLREAHPGEWGWFRLRAELDLYPRVLEDFMISHPEAASEELLP